MPAPGIEPSLFASHFGVYRLSFALVRMVYRYFRQMPDPAQETRWTFYNNEEPNRI